MDVKEAVKNAFESVRSLYEGQDIRDLLLEEVEKDGTAWRITVSFSRPDVSNPMRGVFAAEYLREYKVIELNQLGQLTSMKIRKP